MGEYSHAIVVGASSGMGEALVKRLAASGCKVAAVARRESRLEALTREYPDQVLAFPHDVTHYDSVPALFQEITSQLGGLDLIVYASGVMPPVEVDEYSFDKDRQMVEINYLGAIAWLNQAAVRFGNTQRGTIVGIGSVAGDRGRQGQPVYNSSKAALHTYLEALRNRLDRLGVRVVTIKPGPVRTEMTEHLTFKDALSAEHAAALILKKSKRAGEHYLVAKHAIVFMIIRNIPSWIFRRLKV